jgi:predicted nucleic acid-binding protein
LTPNVLLSALLSPLGAPTSLLDAWERKTFPLVASEVLIKEFRDVAAPPFFRSSKAVRWSVGKFKKAGARDGDTRVKNPWP